ncbi:hypothetical protein BP6252_12019 [Coleophoma cylindrospora]|uniref:Xylanolytic transcriptional activator regulatory domain-containing protein n=1 Tax=Coleophoma cylindrospora TaxID=1849047 RepID=A0A3D8QFK4_9HELO|nr:hypothetical protein BP6252_12019 [Coleophoma cylindrospora]
MQKRLQELRAGIGVSNVDTGAFQFYGPSSHICFLQRIYQRMQKCDNETLLSQKQESVPTGLVKWGLERFLFGNFERYQTPDDAARHNFVAKDMGDTFIASYFEIIHPQLPVLSYPEVIHTWNEFWEPPEPGKKVKGRDIMYMVLAIGARASKPYGRLSVEALESWAEHFIIQAHHASVLVQDPSLKGLQFLLLKMMYAFQSMRPNDVYLCLGQAARDVLTLGINKSQVSDGNNSTLHRLRLTLWTVYANERLSALFAGRPSGFIDDDIEAAFPEDLPYMEDENNKNYMQPAMNLAYVRAMAKLGKVANQVWTGIYSPAGTADGNSRRNRAIISECDTNLGRILQGLPEYLHFYDNATTIGEPWQECQRTNLGLCHYLVQILIHRPALVSATLFASKENTKDIGEQLFDIPTSVATTISAAKSLIGLAHDAIFRRRPAIKQDSGAAFFIVSACVTLLYEVLGPEISASYAKETFGFVEKAVQCLDQMGYVGPTSAKDISVEIMKVAKDAFNSSSIQGERNEDLTGAFPWLNNDFGNWQSYVSQSNGDQPVPSGLASAEQGQTRTSESLVAAQPSVAFDSVDTSMNDHYMCHWLEGGFNASEIPDSLF